MFDSGVTANDLINNLRSEIDVSLAIPLDSFVMWINTIEQLLYTEIIKEQKQTLAVPAGNNISLAGIAVAAGEKKVCYEDILKVYVGRVELTSLDDGTRKTIVTIGMVAAAIGPAFIAIGTGIKAIKGIRNTITELGKGMKLSITMMNLISQMLQSLTCTMTASIRLKRSKT